MTIAILAIWLGLGATLIGGIWLVWHVGNRRRRIRKRLKSFHRDKG